MVNWTTIANLNLRHVHCVDSLGANVLIRSNMPTLRGPSGAYFAHGELLDMIRRRSLEECGIDIDPEDVYLTIVSLNNRAEDQTPDFPAEKAFWRDPANAQHGEFINWPLRKQKYRS